MWVTSFGNGMKVGLINATGVNEVKFGKSDINVYPNPFDEVIYFNVRNLNHNIGKINIYNLNGQLLHSELNTNNSIHTSSLPSGAYILEFIFDNQSREYKKVVK
jgi:hypothetical protein